YNNDGSLDTSLNGTGKLVTDVGSGRYDAANSVAVQTDGKIVVAGTVDSGTSYNFAVTRYNADGGLDTSFNGTGRLVTDIGTNTGDYAYSVNVQPDGKIVVVGSSSGSNFAVVRYNPDGSLDTTFNASPSNTLGGTVAYTENAAAVALDSAVAIYDTELAALASGLGNYQDASVTLARHGGASAQDLFSARGGLRFSSGNVILSGITVGSYTNSDGTLAITFNSNATQARVNSVLSSIGYANSSDAPPASVQIDWIFSDGNSGVQGAGGALSATGSTTVNIMSVNDGPTGSVTISGTAAQGQTLTAANTLADADGLGTISYQWQANGSNIIGATAGTLVLGEAQVGKTIDVVASYTDAGGTHESRTSAVTAVVANVNDAPTGSVTIAGTVEQGQTLTAANTLADADGIGTISYQWQAGGVDIAGANGSSFTLGE